MAIYGDSILALECEIPDGVTDECSLPHQLQKILPGGGYKADMTRLIRLQSYEAHADLPEKISQQPGGTDVAAVFLGLDLFLNFVVPTASESGRLSVPIVFRPEWITFARRLAKALHSKTRHAVVALPTDPAILFADASTFHRMHYGDTRRLEEETFGTLGDASASAAGNYIGLLNWELYVLRAHITRFRDELEASGIPTESLDYHIRAPSPPAAARGP